MSKLDTGTALLIEYKTDKGNLGYAIGKGDQLKEIIYREGLNITSILLTTWDSIEREHLEKRYTQLGRVCYLQEKMIDGLFYTLQN